MTCEPADRIKQSLLVHAPGTTDAIVSLELFNVMDEFFRRTNAWLMQVDFNLVQDQSEYVIPTPPGSCVVRAMAIQHKGVPVPSAQSSVTQNSMGIIDSEMTFPDGDAQYQPDLIDINVDTNIFSWAIYRPDFLTITGITDDVSKEPLTAVLSLSLDKSCLEADCGDWDIPDWMWNSYFAAWYNGTLSSLYGMPAKPWSNAQLAIVHGKRARNKQAFHKQEARRGFNYGTPAWRFPRGGWT